MSVQRVAAMESKRSVMLGNDQSLKRNRRIRSKPRGWAACTNPVFLDNCAPASARDEKRMQSRVDPRLHSSSSKALPLEVFRLSTENVEKHQGAFQSDDEGTAQERPEWVARQARLEVARKQLEEEASKKKAAKKRRRRKKVPPAEKSSTSTKSRKKPQKKEPNKRVATVESDTDSSVEDSEHDSEGSCVCNLK